MTGVRSIELPCTACGETACRVAPAIPDGVASMLPNLARVAGATGAIPWDVARKLSAAPGDLLGEFSPATIAGALALVCGSCAGALRQVGA